MMDRIKRKKEEELEQRRLNETLEDYRQTFETTKASKVAFVRGEVVNADSKHYGKRGEEVVHHHHHQSKSSAFKPIDISEKARKAQEIANRLAVQNPLAASKDHRAFSPPKSSVPVSRPPRPGKVQTKPKLSNLEQFKEELKAMQEKRQERKDEREKEMQQRGVSNDELSRLKNSIINPYLDDNYSEFSENLSTTNLYISFLPIDTTMEDLYDTFGSFGPLASARILYPRPNESRPYLFGFVAYMSRRDAERAQLAMNGAEINGSDIKVNWGKPFYIPPVLKELALPEPQTGLPFNAKPRKQDLDSFLAKYGTLPNFKQPLPTTPPQLQEDFKKMLRNAIVRVVIPTER
uniref:RRM domain-containing protein n=1 Tax=Panagrolaimus superbus TaxID=310955 RepID=A0A914YEH6_9BILA